MKKATRWELPEAKKEQFTVIVETFIQNGQDGGTQEIDLSDTGLTPYQLGLILESLGYEEGEKETNGWEMDFWIDYMKEDTELTIAGCGMTFELRLRFLEEE